MSFICKNGMPHRHDSIRESKICWGLLSSPVIPATRPTPSYEPSRATERQLDYIKDLGGDLDFARSLSKERASKYIDNLRAEGRKKATVTDPRLDFIKGMIDMIPQGYFCIQPEAGAEMTFMRIARPKPGAVSKYAGTTKFQTQHGPRLENAGILWPSGAFSIFDHRLADYLMLLVADHQTASRRYAKEMKRCMRCTAELTDPRSRHYGIGPECEHKSGYGWVIPVVDEEAGATYETLRARGLIDIS